MHSCSDTDCILKNQWCSLPGLDCVTTGAFSCLPSSNESDSQTCFRPVKTVFPVYDEPDKIRDPFRNRINTKQNILQKKYHAYRSIWNCNKFVLDDPKQFIQGEKTVKWKFWPPPVVPVPKGLKLPVQYVQETATASERCPTCDLEPKTQQYYVAGEDDLNIANVKLIKALPQEEFPRESCLCGILNTFESQTFIVSPTKVLFLGTEIGKTYTRTIRVQNNGVTPRRIGVINPRNALIDIDCGAGIGENTLLAPGLHNRIIVTYRPKSADAVHDNITIIVDDDGAIVIPVIAEHRPPPILEMDEWDVGCCSIDNSTAVNFTISNRGGEGRFWILSEEEFMNEYIEVPYDTHTKQGAEITSIFGEIEEWRKIGNRQLTKQESIRIKQLQDQLSEKFIKQTNVLYVKPFNIFPSSFRLQKNQFISIDIKYQPLTADYHIRKLVLLCDNGEVRWIAVKGIGIDPDKSPLMDIQGNWMAPPIDLPTDLNTRLTLDCGDLLAGEMTKMSVTLKNNRCPASNPNSISTRNDKYLCI